MGQAARPRRSRLRRSRRGLDDSCGGSLGRDELASGTFSAPDAPAARVVAPPGLFLRPSCSFALNREKAELAHAHRDVNLAADLDRRAAALEERERELAARESSLTSQEGLTDSQAKRQERREKRLAGMEEAIHDRIRELDEREGEVDQREAALQADVDLRTDKIEARETALAELEAHLTQKESELATYVGKAQTELQRREAVWWDKQLGRDEAVEVDAA